MNPILVILIALVFLAALFGFVSLVLWWLIPLAFPALSFSFGNAMALAGLMFLLNTPAVLSKS